MVMFTLHAEYVVVVVAQSDVVTSVVGYDELRTGDVERTEVEASSQV